MREASADEHSASSMTMPPRITVAWTNMFQEARGDSPGNHLYVTRSCSAALQLQTCHWTSLEQISEISRQHLSKHRWSTRLSHTTRKLKAELIVVSMQPRFEKDLL